MSPWNGEFEAPASIVMQSCAAATAPLKYIIMVLLMALGPPSSSVTLALLGLCGYSQVFEKFEKSLTRCGTAPAQRLQLPSYLHIASDRSPDSL